MLHKCVEVRPTCLPAGGTLYIKAKKGENNFVFFPSPTLSLQSSVFTSDNVYVEPIRRLPSEVTSTSIFLNTS